jgi:hypothetical protein
MGTAAPVPMSGPPQSLDIREVLDFEFKLSNTSPVAGAFIPKIRRH